jgi:hypothetical protein
LFLSFPARQLQRLLIAPLGKDTVKVDIGFGGAFYAYVGTDELGLPPTSIVPEVRGVEWFVPVRVWRSMLTSVSAAGVRQVEADWGGHQTGGDEAG